MSGARWRCSKMFNPHDLRNNCSNTKGHLDFSELKDQRDGSRRKDGIHMVDVDASVPAPPAGGP